MVCLCPIILPYRAGKAKYVTHVMQLNDCFLAVHPCQRSQAELPGVLVGSCIHDVSCLSSAKVPLTLKSTIVSWYAFMTMGYIGHGPLL